MNRVQFFTIRKQRRERMLRKMEKMRAAKKLKREQFPPEHEPMPRRAFPLLIGVRDAITGEEAWTEFRSVRDAAKRLAVVLREYAPGIKTVTTRTR